MPNRIILRENPNGRWLDLNKPVETWVAVRPEDVIATLQAAEAAVAERGLTVAGFVTYEAAAGFDPALVTHDPGHLPAACFAGFETVAPLAELPDTDTGVPPASDWTLLTSSGDYVQRIDAIKQQIELGNTYQVNFTIRLASVAVPDPWSLFLRIAREAPYAAYFELDEFAIVSASPELFFELDGSAIRCRPMKGTSDRGMTTAADRAIAQDLRASTKNRAENIMITDMIRNDLGRIADAGSVQVDAKYAIEKYPTVWQMTSSVSATTDSSIADIFRALFPCASVTGAPKASSMGIIANLEESPREIYTGAIGYIAPGRKAQFSVAIRTALIDRHTGRGMYGAGGGIVWDSEPDDEYEECRIKSRILDRSAQVPPFALLETMRWEPETGWSLLDLHLDRLADSADYFDYPFDREGIERALDEKAADLGVAARVRVTLARDGTLTIQVGDLPIAPSATPIGVRLATSPVDARNPFLFHKTTHREVYERASQSVDECDDVLLWNADGFITETTIANVIVELDGERITPPVADGLLAGTYRRWLLDRGEVIERSIHLDELAGIEEIELVNSVRGSYRGELLTAIEQRSSRAQPSG